MGWGLGFEVQGHLTLKPRGEDDGVEVSASAVCECDPCDIVLLVTRIQGMYYDITLGRLHYCFGGTMDTTRN